MCKLGCHKLLIFKMWRISKIFSMIEWYFFYHFCWKEKVISRWAFYAKDVLCYKLRKDRDCVSSSSQSNAARRSLLSSRHELCTCAFRPEHKTSSTYFPKPCFLWTKILQLSISVILWIPLWTWRILWKYERNSLVEIEWTKIFLISRLHQTNILRKSSIFVCVNQFYFIFLLVSKVYHINFNSIRTRDHVDHQT